MEDALLLAKGFRLILAICLGAYFARYNEATEFTDVFAVEIVGDPAIANSIAARYGFRVLSHLDHFGDVYEFASDKAGERSKRSDRDPTAQLSLDPRVTWVEQQKILQRQKRGVVQRVPEGEEEEDEDFAFNDPLFKNQWYLVDRGQSGGFGGHDLNVVPAWRKGLSGKGVVVTIVDDGVDHKHPDLQSNYDPEASADLNDLDDPFNDPTPNMSDPGNNHGTKCAGAVAAQANNSMCGVGVAFNARIGGIRMLDGVVTDLLESRSLLYRNQYVDIYSSSWGPKDNGTVMDGPRRYTRRALEKGAKEGRNGKGSIFVWATGNGGRHGDDCNCDGYVTSIYTLTVGSIASDGNFTSFGEICPSTMAVVFANGLHSNKDDFAHVVTTDAGGKCTKYFSGTSTAAPLAAGCIALVLEANPNLTWRDVQHLVAETSVVPNEEADGWTVNGAGYHVNHKFGFGAMDCARMVEAALSWNPVQRQKSCILKSAMEPRVLEASQTIVESLVTDGNCNREDSSDPIDKLEHVQVYVKMSHVKRGDISINLTSPSGTTSNLLKVRPLDTSKDGINFVFMTVHSWGESPVGRWTLKVMDNSKGSGSGGDGKVGELESWALGLNGVQGELTNHEKWRMSDGHLLNDGRIGGTKLEDRRRLLEQRHLLSPRTTTSTHEDDGNDNEGHININEGHPNVNEIDDTIFGGYDARGNDMLGNGNGNVGNGVGDDDGADDDDDGKDGDDDKSNLSHEDKLRKLLNRLKAMNRKNHRSKEERISRRGYHGRYWF